ncbi:MAG TPA: phosphopantetheine-binding protein [Vicinamibacterales bacterium]|nr:phosphopantetheine-binding protein [Vicinamibacterales bacterium]
MLKGGPDRESVLAQVRAELASIRARRHAGVIEIDESTRLSELGLTSLDLAEAISSLESVFDVDPFAEAVAITSITDVRSLCDAYLSCLSPSGDTGDDLDRELRAIRAQRGNTEQP